MKNDIHMVSAAGLGYQGAPNEHLFSSSIWMAHQVGADMKARNMRQPVRCSQSRGYSINVLTSEGARFLAKFDDKLVHITFEAR